jgi:peptidyl-prolyl cis-trans isomerase C
MKPFALLSCISVFVLVAQAPEPQGKKPASPANAASANVDTGQSAPPRPDTVIATVNGKKLTFGEFETLLRSLPPQMQQNAMQNKKAFVNQFALMRKLADIAETSKLDQVAPYKDALEFSRMNIMAQAEINEAPKQFLVQPADQQKFYEANKERYNTVKVKVIYIPFSANPVEGADGKKPLSEAEAKAKAEDLLKQIHGGADFVKLVKEHSRDATSVAKDGDIGTFTPADNLPDAIKAIVFKLKQGEVSEPVRQPNGYYLLKAQEIAAKPFSEVRDQIYSDIQKQRMQEWMDATNKSLNITYDNEAFFAAGPPAAAAPKAPPAPPK